MEFIEAVKLTRELNKLIPVYMSMQEIEKYINKKEIKRYWNKNKRIVFDEGIKILELENYKFLDLKKIVKNNDNKYGRVKKRIKKMLKNKCWFATYTINDENMNKDHRRKLKEINNGKNYIINVDYGKTSKRKHYHAIIESEEEPKKWEYGFCKFIEIRENENVEKRIAKYLNKLVAHTLKEYTDKEKIIYSRTRVYKK